MIKIEKIHGTLLLIGAEDDVLWYTAKYIRRMELRMKERPHTCRLESVIYEHATHFVFPESMLKMNLCQYFGHKKLNSPPSIAYAERIISYAARASSSTCCGVL